MVQNVIGILVEFLLVSHLATSVHWPLQMVRKTHSFSSNMRTMLMPSTPIICRFKNLEAHVDASCINS